MANRYWIGGTGTWDTSATTHWSTASGLSFTASCTATALTTTGSPALVVGMTVYSSTFVSLGTIVSGSVNSWVVTIGGTYTSQSMSAGTIGASVPTSTDAVFLDANSGVATISLGASVTCGGIDCTGFAGTLSGTTAYTFTTAGNFKLSSGMTYGLVATVFFSGTAATPYTITTAGKTITNNTSNNSTITNGNWTLQDAFASTGSGSGFTISGGGFDSNNFALTIGSDFIVSTSGTVSFGSSIITLTSAQYGVNFGSFTGTLNAGTSTISLTGPASNGFIGNGKTFYNLVIGANANTFPITGANTFNNVTITGRTSIGISNITLAANQIVNGTFSVSSSANPAMRTFVRSNTENTSRTITAAVVSIFYADFRDITGAGVASPFTGTSLGNCTNNSGITFTTAQTVYWNLAGAQNWSATGWATSSGGAPAVANFPLAQDTAVFNNAGSVTGTISVNTTWNIGTINMSARTSAMTLSMSSAPIIYGDWTNGSGTTISGASTVTFSGRITQTITSAAKSFTQAVVISSVGGTVTLADALVSSGTLTLSFGTFTTGNFNVTSSTFSNSSANTRTLNLGSSLWTITGSGASAWLSTTTTGLTLNAGTSKISFTSATAKTFAGGAGLTYYNINQGGAGALTLLASNTLNDIQNSYSATGATTITVQGTPQTVANFTATGAVGRVLTLNSNTAASARTLTKTGGGIISVDYMSIRDSTATGAGATWYAGANSTNVSNNTGWIFTAAPNSGNFFFLMQ